MIPPTDAAVCGLYELIGIVCGTQMGKTASLFNIGGEKIDSDPAPVLWIGPTRSNIASVIIPQFESMIRGCRSLKGKMHGARQKTLLKEIAGTTFRFAWAGSATEIASQPAHTVVIDEVDKCVPIPGHGSVLVQGQARISNYRHSGGVVIATSSPTEGSVETMTHEGTGLEHFTVADPDDVSSEMWRIWQNGTRHEFMVPCPHCGEYFAPRLKYLTGWASGATPMQAKRAAKLAHWKCGSLINENHKEWMISNGLAIAPGQRVVGGEVVGDAPETQSYSIWISGLCSPWVSWGQRAYEWVTAVRSHDSKNIQAVINLSFGELFRVRGEAPPWENILQISQASSYDIGVAPSGVRKVFLTCDVQADHLVVVIRGWGVEMESWLIQRLDIYGDTSQPEVWDKLSQLVDAGVDWKPINAVAVDSGFRTEMVYAWCERRLGLAYATKGYDAPSKLYAPSEVETLKNGKKVLRGVKRWNFDSGYFKGWVHDRIPWPQDAPGSWHLPTMIGEDYCRQVVGEQRMRLASGKSHWVKTATNDYLDCEALQALLAHIEGVRFLKPETPNPTPTMPRRGARSAGLQL